MAASTSTYTRRSTGRPGDVALVFVLVLLALIFMFPFFWTVSSSLKAPSEILTYPPTFVPAVPQWGNYARVFALSPFAIRGNPVCSWFRSCFAFFGRRAPNSVHSSESSSARSEHRG